MGEEGKYKWPDLLPMVCLTMNSAPSDATKFSPYQLLFGRPARLPIEHHISPTLPSGSWEASARYLQGLQAALKCAQDEVRKHVCITVPRINPYAVGDRISVRNLPLSNVSKLDKRWDGPYVVIHIPNQFQVTYYTHAGVRRTLHVNDVKSFCPPLTGPLSVENRMSQPSSQPANIPPPPSSLPSAPLQSLHHATFQPPPFFAYPTPSSSAVYVNPPGGYIRPPVARPSPRVTLTLPAPDSPLIPSRPATSPSTSSRGWSDVSPAGLVSNFKTPSPRRENVPHIGLSDNIKVDRGLEDISEEPSCSPTLSDMSVPMSLARDSPPLPLPPWCAFGVDNCSPEIVTVTPACLDTVVPPSDAPPLAPGRPIVTRAGRLSRPPKKFADYILDPPPSPSPELNKSVHGPTLPYVLDLLPGSPEIPQESDVQSPPPAEGTLLDPAPGCPEVPHESDVLSPPPAEGIQLNPASANSPPVSPVSMVLPGNTHSPPPLSG